MTNFASAHFRPVPPSVTPDYVVATDGSSALTSTSCSRDTLGMLKGLESDLATQLAGLEPKIVGQRFKSVNGTPLQGSGDIRIYGVPDAVVTAGTAAKMDPYGWLPCRGQRMQVDKAPKLAARFSITSRNPKLLGFRTVLHHGSGITRLIGSDMVHDGTRFVNITNTTGIAMGKYLSTDGLTWTAPQATDFWYGGTDTCPMGGYVSGPVWVSVMQHAANLPTVVRISTDNGATFTQRLVGQAASSYATADYVGCAYGNGRIVLHSGSSGNAAVSTDNGATWTYTTTACTVGVRKIVFLAGTFYGWARFDRGSPLNVNRANVYNGYMSSTDGLTWSVVSAPSMTMSAGLDVGGGSGYHLTYASLPSNTAQTLLGTKALPTNTDPTYAAAWNSGYGVVNRINLYAATQPDAIWSGYKFYDDQQDLGYFTSVALFPEGMIAITHCNGIMITTNAVDNGGVGDLRGVVEPMPFYKSFRADDSTLSATSVASTRVALSSDKTRMLVWTVFGEYLLFDTALKDPDHFYVPDYSALANAPTDPHIKAT